MLEISLATCSAIPALPAEDAILVRALEHRGIRGTPVVWDGPQSLSARATLIRSAWDYHLRHAQFLAWVERVSAGRPLWNDPAIVRWNSHKSYLRDLAARGVAAVPTIWMEAGRHPALARALDQRGWGEVVIKPAVSASAHRTARFARDARAAAQRHLDALTADGMAMVQPYLSSVEDYGERSFIFIDGEFTHAVRRQAVLSQKYEYDAPAPRVEPTVAELMLCRKALSVLDSMPLYARVDVAPDAHGAPWLMELELIEPRLYFREGPEAAELLADGVAQRLASSA
jgi:hypothetical protein